MDFLKKVLTLLSGTILAQIVSIFLIPLISRLYLPAETGISGNFIAFVITLSVGINGGYEAAIMLPKTLDSAKKLAQVGLLICSFLCTFLFIICFFFGSFFLKLGNVSELNGYILLLPLSLFLEGSSQIFRFYLNRLGKYHFLTGGKIANVLARNLLSILLGFLHFHFSGLIFAFILGQFANLLFLIWGLKRETISFFSFSIQNIKEELAHYQDFPKFGLISSWLNSAAKQLPFFILPLFYAKEITGWFAQADKVLAVPLLVALAIGEVFYQKANEAAHLGQAALYKITRQTFGVLALLGIVPTLICILGGKTLFAWVLGQNYAMSGEYARWLAPAMFLSFIAAPLSYLIDIQRKLREFFYFNVLLFAVRLITLFVSGMYLSDVESLRLYGLSGFVMMLFQLWYLWAIVKPVEKKVK
jgi:O-antigen/teichoic acid export membrane protein